MHKLPALLKSELSPFTELNNPPKIEGFNIQEAWKKWSIDFQSNMPIFAERWSTNRGNNRRDNLSSLDDEILNLISDKFKIYLKQLTDGASINNLKFSQIENFEFLIPNIEKQKLVIDKIEKNEIAVDNLINNNLEKNELLKELKLQLLNELLD